jgi:Icc-related predicted phosphoesterase
MPKIVCLSDTHNRNEQINVPDGDILIHAGDATGRGTIDEIVLFNEWFATLQHPHKIFVAGNHDWLFETSNRFARTLLDSSIHYLQDSFVEVEGLKIYGSPWQPRFFDWAFNLTRGVELAKKWKLIPTDTDVLITHGPPFGILDEVSHQYWIENTGCEELRKRVERIRPRLHVFGHIHCGFGQAENSGVQFINASNCDENYEPVNPPIVFDL